MKYIIMSLGVMFFALTLCFIIFIPSYNYHGTAEGKDIDIVMDATKGIYNDDISLSFLDDNDNKLLYHFQSRDEIKELDYTKEYEWEMLSIIFLVSVLCFSFMFTEKEVNKYA